MFSGSAIVIAILVAFLDQVMLSGASTSESSSATLTPSEDSTVMGGSTATSPPMMVSSTVTSPPRMVNSTTTSPPMMVSSTVTSPPMTGSATVTTATINPSTTPAISSSTTVHTTEKPTTKPLSEKTYGNISIELQTPWQESHRNSSSDFHMELINLLRDFFSDSSKYSDVNVSVLILIQKGEGVILNATLCVVVKSDDAGFIEDKIAKDGKIGSIKVVEGSLKFTAIGVELSHFKAQDGECGKCSEGGAGPIVIERECKANPDYSCKGVKTTKETNDCVAYCGSSAVAMSGISTLILGMGFLLSASLIIWE